MADESDSLDLGFFDIPASNGFDDQSLTDAFDAVDSSISNLIGGSSGEDVGSVKPSTGSKKVADSTMDGNSLIAALAGDATTVAGGFFAADVAKTTVKKNPGSANTLILAAAGVAALVVLVIFLKK